MYRAEHRSNLLKFNLKRYNLLGMTMTDLLNTKNKCTGVDWYRREADTSLYQIQGSKWHNCRPSQCRCIKYKRQKLPVSNTRERSDGRFTVTRQWWMTKGGSNDVWGTKSVAEISNKHCYFWSTSLQLATLTWIYPVSSWLVSCMAKQTHWIQSSEFFIGTFVFNCCCPPSPAKLQPHSPGFLSVEFLVGFLS